MRERRYTINTIMEDRVSTKPKQRGGVIIHYPTRDDGSGGRERRKGRYNQVASREAERGRERGHQEVVYVHDTQRSKCDRERVRESKREADE